MAGTISSTEWCTDVTIPWVMARNSEWCDHQLCDICVLLVGNSSSSSET